MAGTGDESRLSIARVLMKGNAEADIGDLQDTTPLMEAAMLGDAELCKLLLDRGADMRRCGAGGLSARELASKFEAVRQVFDEQAEKGPQVDDDEDDEESQPVQVTLRHAQTQIERVVTVPGNSTVCDLKKHIVRLSNRGSWRRIALLTEQGRILHDTEYLNGRSVLTMADAKSAEAQRAAEESLPEEERWKRWTFDDLRAEADRRGIFGGNSKEQVLESLIEVKRWEGFTVKELKSECSKRGVSSDACNDKEDLLLLLKQDLSWDTMEVADLKMECDVRGIAMPDETGDSLSRSLRSRLRQVLRWEGLPEPQLRNACELRNFVTEGKSKDDLLAFLKSFKTLPKPQPKPKPKPESSRRPTTPRAGGGAGSRQRSQSRASRHADDDDDDCGHVPPDVSERVRRIAMKYPGFMGEYLPELEDWTDAEIDAYFYSNGHIRPHKKRAPSLPKANLRMHLKILHLQEGATSVEVRKSYRKLALIYHPDKQHNENDSEAVKAAAENFRAIADAYEALTQYFNEQKGVHG
uniref:J domain-containing protein n=1 Tax=Alexandrium andersonii TaxID=327968 RepID=A0A7S2GDU2_9DINO